MEPVKNTTSSVTIMWIIISLLSGMVIFGGVNLVSRAANQANQQQLMKFSTVPQRQMAKGGAPATEKRVYSKWQIDFNECCRNAGLVSVDVDAGFKTFGTSFVSASVRRQNLQARCCMGASLDSTPSCNSVVMRGKMLINGAKGFCVAP